MGTEYKRNYKNLVGRPDIIGRDVWEVGVTPIQAAAWDTGMTDRFGSLRYEAGADARLEGVHMALSSGSLTLGRVGVQVALDGVVVASGNLHSGGPGAKYIALKKVTLEDVPVSSGSVLTVSYAVEQSLDTAQGLRASLSLTTLEYPERA